MRKAVLDYLESAGIVIKAAAVADYRPASKSESKIKKRDGNLQIELERNPDIIAEIGKIKGDRILIGFAMETDDLIENAKKKLMDKNMDLIVANDLNAAGAGFQGDTNCVKLIGRDGAIEDVPLMEKIEVANRILSKIKVIRSERIS